jgi:hypothetical protein
MRVYSHELFTYAPATKTFVTEASDLGSEFNPRGFDLRGPSRTVAFYLDRTVRDTEGDVLAWHYSGHDGTRGHYFANVFND